MAEVEVRFEREKQEGIVAVGTYVIDAAKRFGIRFENACDGARDAHYCSIFVTKGAGLLSSETNAESEHFRLHGRRTNERLACQVKIENPGEVVIMTKNKAESATPETASDDRNEEYRKEFAEMPLEKKIANLVQLETIALGETVSFIINSPFKVADKVLDVMAEFGFKKEEQQKGAARPDEHKTESRKATPNTKKKKTPKSKSSS
jgi:ferredoxin